MKVKKEKDRTREARVNKDTEIKKTISPKKAGREDIEMKKKENLKEIIYEMKDSLKAKEKEKQKSKIEFDNLDKNTFSLRDDINELEQSISEIEQIFNDYNKDFKNREEEKKAIVKDSKDKKDFIESVLDKGKRREIDDVIKENEDQISELKNTISSKDKKSGKVSGLVNDLKKAEDDLNSAQKTHDEKEEKYNIKKNTKNTIDENLRKLNDLKKSIDEEKVNENKYKMYFFFKELGDLLKETEIENPDTFRASLYSHSEELAKAKEDLRKKESHRNKIKDTLEATRRNLKEAEDNRERNILENISRIPK